MTNISQSQKIGATISKLRQAKGITQSHFAKILKTSQPAVARMEKGEQNFSTQMLAKISGALNQEIISLAGQSLSFKIQGGAKLSGRVSVKSSKNAAVALLCASLLNKGRTLLENVPKIEEVNRVVEVLVSLGVHIKWHNSDLEIQPPKTIDIAALNKQAAVKTRSVLMLIGPLAHWLKKFELPLAGGCRLGRRTIRPHLYAMEASGVKIKTVHDKYEISVGQLVPSEVLLYETGDTVTENALMLAALIPGLTSIRLASANYMVQDLCYFLQDLGVNIEGIGTSSLRVHGLAEINKDIKYTIGEDPIEAMLFLSLAATTNSSILIERCPLDFLQLELFKLEKMGFNYKILRRYKSQNSNTNLADIKTFPSRLVALEEKIHPLPSNAGVNIDNLPFFVPIAIKARGTTLIHDWVYENRAVYYMELNKLRANLILADPHRVYVEGPSELRGAEIVCPPALRPAAIILIAMLAAKGESVLRNVYSINRGYEDLVGRLQQLGAKIEAVNGW